MKKKVVLLLTLALTASMFTGCGNTASNETESTEAPDELEETEEESHEHVYTEEVTIEATCETDGEKTFTCECGDSYTEVIAATGHVFENYVYNEDATYEADGTETATCENCDVTDTRIAEGTMLTYTFNDMSATKYAKTTVNVRNLPNTDGERLGSLSLNQEVTVTGQCNETGWYRIEFSGDTAYVSDSYLVDSKVEVQTGSSSGTTASNANSSGGSSSDNSSSGNEVCPYPLYTIMYDNRGYPYYYGKWGGSANMDADNWAKTQACDAEVSNYMQSMRESLGETTTEIIDGVTVTSTSFSYCMSWSYIGTYSGMRVVVRYVGTGSSSTDTPEAWGINTAGNKL